MNDLTYIAHRGFLMSEDDPGGNSLLSINTAVKQGLGVEVDLRWTSPHNNLVLTHDPIYVAKSYATLKDATPYLKKAPIVLLNVKEQGMAGIIANYLHRTKLDKATKVWVTDVHPIEIPLYYKLDIPVAHRASAHEAPLGAFIGDNDIQYCDPAFYPVGVSRSTGWIYHLQKYFEFDKVIVVGPEIHGYTIDPFLMGKVLEKDGVIGYLGDTYSTLDMFSEAKERIKR